MLEAARCPEVQMGCHEEMVAAGEIWSLSDVQVSPVIASLVPGCWGKSQMGLLLVCE